MLETRRGRRGASSSGAWRMRLWNVPDARAVYLCGANDAAEESIPGCRSGVEKANAPSQRSLGGPALPEMRHHHPRSHAHCVHTASAEAVPVLMLRLDCKMFVIPLATLNGNPHSCGRICPASVVRVSSHWAISNRYCRCHVATPQHHPAAQR